MSTPTIESTTVSSTWDTATTAREAKIPAPAAYQPIRMQQPMRVEPDTRRSRDLSAWRRVDPFRWVSHRREHVGLSAPDDI